jgi:hypothetical protein
MKLLFVILLSIVAIIIIIASRRHEDKTGRSYWSFFGADGLLRKMDAKLSNIWKALSVFQAKNLIVYMRRTGEVLKNFYIALQKVTARKIAAIGNPSVTDHGNRAASFYLKNIKEHKDNQIDSIKAREEFTEGSEDGNIVSSDKE